MVGSTKQPDTVVAERLYCRAGKRVTTFFYKHADSTNEIFASARTASKEAVAKAKIVALQRWGELRGMEGTAPADKTVAGLFTRYFAWQAALPPTSTLKKADSTILENKREQKRLLAYFGAMLPPAVTATMIYDYIDLRTEAEAPAKAVKEAALLSAVFEYGRRKGVLVGNPCHGIKAEKSVPRTRNVTWPEIEFLTQVGRELGGTYHVQALAARAAWLAFKRPGEVLKLPRSGQTMDGRPLGVTEAGLVFMNSKRKRAQGERTTLIKWTPTLRETIDEALKVGRWANFQGSRLIFGTMGGTQYSRSGWGTIWGRLMVHCEKRAAELERDFNRFSLMDCRPGGVTEKKRTKQDDVYDGTGHADRRMIDSIYDRREEKSSTAAK